ncbi:MAG: ROK family protein [Bryobacteraceae bacterium]|nr:ROK family protein [Bryobacteraceae bacterium]
MPKYGAIEAGGTKFMVAVGKDPLRLERVTRIATSDEPAETIGAVVEYFRGQGPLDALGIATFGPVDFATGRITTTPKLAWRNYPLKETLERALGVRAGFDTDVNAAALAEARLGAGRGAGDLVYFTVGTGIGGGAIAGGRLVHGMMHPEMGHLPVRRAAEEAPGFAGVCPYHGDCLEGMASGPALEARWGRRAELLPADHPAWRVEADYLAQACMAVACVLSPRVIVLGGGVMEQEHLIAMVRQRLEEQARGYFPLPRIERPALEHPGLSGALMLAMEAAR